MNILCKYEKKIRVRFFSFICIFRKYMFCVQLCMGNGPVEGAIISILKHSKVYYSKTHPNFFNDFCIKCHATIPEHN